MKRRPIFIETCFILKERLSKTIGGLTSNETFFYINMTSYKQKEVLSIPQCILKAVGLPFESTRCPASIGTSCGLKNCKDGYRTSCSLKKTSYFLNNVLLTQKDVLFL